MAIVLSLRNGLNAKSFFSIIVVSIICFVAFSNATPKTYHAASMDPQELEALFGVVEGFLGRSNWRLSHPHPCSDDILPGTVCQEGSDKLLHVTRLQFGTGINPRCKPNATIPVQISKLPYLQVLLISECFMRFNITIPTDLENLAPSLRELSLRGNDALVGNIPTSLGNLKNLEVLSVSQNKIGGRIPLSLSDLKKLQHLDLSYNALSGEIPDIIGSLSSLTILDVSGNNLEGTIPPSLGKLTSLQKLDLSSNMLRGEVPSELGKLQNLAFLALSTNGFVGALPLSLRQLQNVECFLMDNNPLHTHLPHFLESWKKLTELSLSNSKYVGAIPEFLGNLRNLSVLDLSHNMLTGNIPASFEGLAKMSSLNLSDNMLTGAIPLTEDFMRRLGERLDLHGNVGLCLKDSSVSGNGFLREFRDCNAPTSSKKGFQGDRVLGHPPPSRSHSGARQQNGRGKVVAATAMTVLFFGSLSLELWQRYL